MTTLEKKPLLQVIGLSTHFLSFGGKRVVKAVDRVSFEANDGERVAIIGESGCGKSTVSLSILQSLLQPGLWKGKF
jgi:ABC-type oligopeptide transport system ATPase subunit